MLRLATACTLLALLFAAPAHGQIYVDADATGANDGSSWADAYTDLQTAIDAAGSDALWIAEGIYTPDSQGDSFTIPGAKDGIKLYGGFDGTESSRDQRAPAEHRTILSGDLNGDDRDPNGDGIIEDAVGDDSGLRGGENAHHVLLLDGTTAPISPATRLDGLVVTAGQADGAAPDDRGGGLYCDGSGNGSACSPSLHDVRFVGNAADEYGGSVYGDARNEGESSPVVTEALVKGSGYGGVVLDGGLGIRINSQGATTSPTIADSRFVDNETAEDNIGALAIAVFDGEPGQVTITRTAFVENGFGANIVAEGADSQLDVRITNAVFARNDGRGAARFEAGNGAELTTRMDNSVVSGNVADDKAPVKYEGDGEQSSLQASVTNTTFFGNAVESDRLLAGDAMYVTRGRPEDVADLDVRNSIVWSGPGEGGTQFVFWLASEVTLSNTIVDGGTDAVVREGMPAEDVRYLDEDGTDTSFEASTNQDVLPAFVDGETPPGPDGTFATGDDGLRVLRTSPAVDAGDTDALPADAADLDDDGNTTEPIPIDLIGNARVQDLDDDGTAATNVGAYETAATGPPVALTDSAEDVTTLSAILAGTVNPSGGETTTTFEYRRAGASSFTTVAAEESPLPDTAVASVRAPLDDLTPGTTYEYRVVATNETGADEGALVSFTTPTVELAVTEGGSDGLNRRLSQEPDAADQPAGVMRLTPSAPGGELTQLRLTPRADWTGGVERVSLWLSADDTLDTETARELASVPTDPATRLPSPLTLDGLQVALPPEPRYLFVTIDLADGGEPRPAFALASEEALAVDFATIASVNGTATSTFADLPLSPQSEDGGLIYVDAEATGANDGSSWADAYTDLQSALGAAGPDDEIWIADGVYVPGDTPDDSFVITGALDGLRVYGGFDGGEPVRTARVPREHRAILSGDLDGDDVDPDEDGIVEDVNPNDEGRAQNLKGDNAHRVLVLDGTTGGDITARTVIDGVTVTAGNSGDFSEGAGLLCDGSGSGNACSATVSNVLFSGNHAGGSGGGMAVNAGEGGVSSPIIHNARFTGNDADGAGGGLYIYAGRSGESRPLITDTEFVDNRAGSGGAVYVSLYKVQGGFAPTFARVRFVENTTPWVGGALHVVSRDAAASAVITDARFRDNTAADGAAISSQLFRGGAMDLDVSRAVFAGNAVHDSTGGVLQYAAQKASDVESRVVNSVFTGSTGSHVSYDGSGPSAAPRFVNVVFEGATGPAVTHTAYDAEKAPVAFVNSILWGNAGGVTNVPPAVDISHSIVPDTAFVTGSDGNLSRAPRFLDPRRPAGADGTFGTRDDGLNVQRVSPALDAGRNAAVPSDTSTDLTGAPRVQDRDGDGTATVNLGAYEEERPGAPVARTGTLDTVTPTAATVTGTVTPNGTPASAAVEYRRGGASSFERVEVPNGPFTGTAAQPVRATVRGLTPGATYEVRITATGAGTGTGELVRFSTPKTEVAVTGGGFGGLARTFRVYPGEADQPIGVLRLIPRQTGAALTGLTVTPKAEDVKGVEQVGLWWSADATWDADDAELARLDLDPTTALPGSLAFEDVARPLPAEARYLFVTVSLTSDAEGTVAGYVARDADLSLREGQVTSVNGNEQTEFSTLPLSEAGTPLPVALAFFDGETVEEAVRLTWKPAAEQTDVDFRVQRRVPAPRAAGERRGKPRKQGGGTWTEVGVVEGGGPTSGAQTYRFTDADLPYAADSLAYRLQVVKAGGSTALTDPVTVGRDGPDGVELLGTAPNPARSRATVRFAVPEDRAADAVRLRLYDVLGRRVRTVRAEAEPGRHEHTLDVTGLSSGVYVLRLQAGGQTKTRKLTVVR
jgi:hypothetical protein